MARSTTLALIAAAAALAWSVGADAQQQQRPRQPRPAAPPKATATPKPAPPAPVPLVNVQTDPSGAACQIVGPWGMTRVFGTPESVLLPNRAGNEQLVCNKPGFREMRGPLAPTGQATTLALAVDPNSKVVTRESVDPGIPLQTVTFEKLMELQRLYRDGKQPERLYFRNRLYFIAHDASLPPVPAPRPAARTVRPAG